MSQPNH